MSATFFEKITDSFEILGMAATRVVKKDKGKVEVKALSYKELSKLLSLYDTITEIPTNYTIYDRNGVVLTNKKE
jgi:hypothetical protein